MNKIIAYLQEHLAGDITEAIDTLDAYSRDASILTRRPEILIMPATLSDIRKTMRFCWQLAEKGHVLPVTVRGGGSDQNGAALSSGIAISMMTYMDKILEFDQKQHLIRLQPGVRFSAVNDFLRYQQQFIPAFPASYRYSSIGGAVANNSGGILSGSYGQMANWTSRLEVVLANGEVLQTERISKRELNRRQGLQTFEGEIYREVDKLLEENRSLLENASMGGYEMLANVRQPDGSFDLTPLFVGSQGTLGIITEMILKTAPAIPRLNFILAGFNKGEQARDAMDHLRSLNPAVLNYYDGEIYLNAVARGRKLGYLTDATEAVLMMAFHDPSARKRSKLCKKAIKILDSFSAQSEVSSDSDLEELIRAAQLSGYWLEADKHASPISLFDGTYIPPERFEEFVTSVHDLAAHNHVPMVVSGRVLDNIYNVRPRISPASVGGKQKIIRILREYSNLVEKLGGSLAGEGGEGRLRTLSVRQAENADLLAVYDRLKSIFDPYNLMNPGVKQALDPKSLVSSLAEDYSLSRFSPERPYF